MMPENGRAGFASLVFVMLLALAGCRTPAKLPPRAMSALQWEWDDLGLGLEAENHIQRAWPGDLNRVSGEFSMPNLELWCVEVQYDLQLAPSDEGNSMIWIVVKPDERSAWSASILMTMSSIWAYEACGVIE